ncbi:Transcriptional regulator containing an amidase domain and an AraC-type DNA-binding HTH domain [Candidatus Nitrosocosmicus arcticus]|uniref:Transcriptional regulator containing an amidase domain and an AraC-type DNA-binding HTH domain n=2 Tax=Candidatus Nitrosocosmicus arcticus TaxID=2035267 RepID=A0A557SR78_9ARCH|nr:Transcriptional regulator containing an amidase domain and an AraC-type DNA-binding HTH domain [Candidatus Nitrosocosmicus arcticus]
MHLDMLSTTEKKNSSVKTVGILIFNDVEVLDVAGPFEVFSMTRLDEDKRYETTSPFRVVLLSEKKTPVIAIGGLKLIPDFTFDDCPDLDLFVIPGGWGTRREVNNSVLIQEISKLSAKSNLTASVCTGSSLIGRAGLLDGKKATTHWRAYNFLRESAPKAQIQKNVVFTIEGPIFTSAGVASGIRLSLYLVSHFFGTHVGKETARFLEFPYPV